MRPGCCRRLSKALPPLSKTQALDPPTRLRRPASERPILIGHEIYRASSYGPYHPLRVPRVSTVLDLTHALGWVAPGQFLRAPRIKPEALHVWHTPEYVCVTAPSRRRERRRAGPHNIGTHANPVFPEMRRRPATSAGGSMLAGMLLEEGGSCITRRAEPTMPCPMPLAVFAISMTRCFRSCRCGHMGHSASLMDIDAHHRDGVEAGLAQDRESLLISVHEETGGRGRGLWARWALP